MSFSPRKRHTLAPSTSASGSASSEPSPSQVTQRRETQSSQSQSQSDLQQSPQGNQQSQPVYPWSAHAPPSGQSTSPFPRCSHALSLSATATGELFLFGGYAQGVNTPSNDLQVISTKDFSTTLLKTSGDVPSRRYGHRAVLTRSTLLVWGGITFQYAQYQRDDDSFYLLDLVSREWTCIVAYGPGPRGRIYHTMTLVGSKLFVFGGRSVNGCLNDAWALDLDCLKSNPVWESYEPAPGNEKPLPRAGHVSVTTGDRIIIFGGYGGQDFNDTWSFNISTRKWTKLQCTGSIPSPRAHHAAVLVDDVMYVFGGITYDGTCVGDLAALNLSTQRWTVFQDIGPSPCRRRAHAMASDGRRVFVLGGALSPGAQADEARLIHVLDTKLLVYPNTVKRSEKTTQLAQKLSAGHPAQIATSEEMGRSASSQITRERCPSLNGLPSRPTGANGMPRRVPEEDDDGKGSTEYHANLVALAPSGKEIARLEDGGLIELERQLLETLLAKTKRDRRIAQLTDELVLKGALLEQVRADAAEAKKRAGLELRTLQAKVDELLLSRDQALEQAQSALQEATFRALLEQAEASAAAGKKPAGLEKRELQAKFDELLPAKSKAEADTSRVGTEAAAGAVNMDVDRVMTRLMERVRAVEAEMASLRGKGKSINYRLLLFITLVFIVLLVFVPFPCLFVSD